MEASRGTLERGAYRRLPHVALPQSSRAWLESQLKAAARAKALAEGGFWVTLEEYTKMAAEAFAAYPYISLPCLILLFGLIFKFARPDKEDRARATPKKTVSKEVVKEEASAGKDVTMSEEKEKGKLRQRKGKESTEEQEESSKDK